MMPITSVSGVAAAAAASTSTVQGTASATKGNNDFMTLLLAELTHQNPMEPLKDNEMMSQYTSLNSVQELQSIRAMMTQMGQGSQIGYAASLIGKYATVNKTNGDQLKGEVTAVTIEAGKVMIQIGEEKAPLENVTVIKDV
jgi:flagellar basal-body rod modification protein FlgD